MKTTRATYCALAEVAVTLDDNAGAKEVLRICAKSNFFVCI